MVSYIVMEQKFYALSDLAQITGLTRQGVHYMLRAHNVPVCRYGTQGLILLKERDFKNAVNKGIFKVNRRVR